MLNVLICPEAEAAKVTELLFGPVTGETPASIPVNVIVFAPL